MATITRFSARTTATGAELDGNNDRLLALFGRRVDVTDPAYGATPGSDSTAAFLAAASEVSAAGGGTVLIPPGTFILAPNTLFDGLENVTFEGCGMRTSIIKFSGNNLYFKAPKNVHFYGLGFSGAQTNATYQTLWVTGFRNVSFRACRFSGFGGATVNIAGSCALCFAAIDTADTYRAAGDSEIGLVDACEFDGNGRMTNFGIRVYTDWVTVGVATCRQVDVTNSHFTGWNWNAVELAGPNTLGCMIANCTASLCGLSPFDVDKGAHSNVLNGLTIYRLLGNIDLVANPNTRVPVVNLQGVAAAGAYARNNTIVGVTAYLLASDIGAYTGYGYCAVAATYAQNSTISKVNVFCDVLPNRANSNSPFAFATVAFATISGVTIKDVTTVNATAGIIETEARDNSVGDEWCLFDDIKNIGTMTGHAISSTYGGATYFRYRFVRTNMRSNLSDCRPTAADKSLIKLAATSSGITCVAIEDSSFYSSAAGVWGVQYEMPRLSIHRCEINVPAQANLFKGGATGNRLHYGANTWQSGAVDVGVAFGNLASTCVIFQGYIGENAGGGYGAAATWGSPLVWHGTAAPVNPPIAYFSSGAKIQYFAPTAGGFTGIIATPSAWKTYGAISA